MNGSAKSNAQRGITGGIFFHNNRFLQALEGDAEAKDELYEKVLRDAKRKDITKLYEKAKPPREVSPIGGCSA